MGERGMRELWVVGEMGEVCGVKGGEEGGGCSKKGGGIVD